MSTDEKEKVKETSSILDYVEKFIDKRDRDLHQTARQGVLSPPLAPFDRSTVIIQRAAEDLPHSESTGHMVEPDLTSDPETDTLKGSEQRIVRSHSQSSTSAPVNRPPRDQSKGKSVQQRTPSRPISYNRCIPTNLQVPTSRNLPPRHPEPSARPQEVVRSSPVNRYIEHRNVHTSVEVEFIRLPVIRLHPREYYHRSVELTQLDNIRSSINNSGTFQWRI